MITAKSTPIIPPEQSQPARKGVRRRRLLRSQHRWMKQVRPEVPNPYRKHINGSRILPSFVPSDVEVKVCQLPHISYSVLEHMDFSGACLNRSEALQCMRNAVAHQERAFERLEQLLELTPATHNPQSNDEQSSQLASHLFNMREIDEVSMGMEQQERGDTSDDFMFKEPTPPTRLEHPYLLDASLAENNILHDYRHGQLPSYFFQ